MTVLNLESNIDLLKLDKDFDYWLMKFDNVSKNGDHGLEDVPEYILQSALIALMESYES